jgi:pyruvate dehydrogenase E2 component (dihydrolipoamide acetyltransferase)
MSIEIVVPRLGWSMDEGTFAGWLKRDGQWVAAGEMLFVLESDKAAQEIESFDAGILRIPPQAPAVGDTVVVGQVLAFLVAKSEKAPFELQGDASAAEARPMEAGATSLQTAVRQPRENQARAVVPAESNRSAGGTSVTPRARRAARKLNVDCATIRVSGRHGRVREQDVLQAAAAGGSEQTVRGPGRIVPVTRLRRAIAERMAAGVHVAAPVTLTLQADATRLVELRRQWKSAHPNEVVPTYTDIFVKLAAAALDEHRQLTWQWQAEGIFAPDKFDIAFAVDTEAGLVAPVVRDVPDKTLAEIAAASRTLGERARSGRLTADELQGGVFTITNLGNYGIDAFTPIINLPQSAILGIGRIARQPVVVDDTVQLRDMTTLSLTFDHRVVDGAPAARFLQSLGKAAAEMDASRGA